MCKQSARSRGPSKRVVGGRDGKGLLCRFYLILQRGANKDFVLGARECLDHVGH